MRISVDEARAYFTHPSQQKASKIMPEALPDHPSVQYWATGGVCGVFHPAHWPAVWVAHYGVRPEAWGRAVKPAKAVLRAFWAANEPELIIGWTDESNRAALAFARRLGFRVHGEMDLPGGKVIEQNWRP